MWENKTFKVLIAHADNNAIYIFFRFMATEAQLVVEILSSLYEYWGIWVIQLGWDIFKSHYHFYKKNVYPPFS